MRHPKTEEEEEEEEEEVPARNQIPPMRSQRLHHYPPPDSPKEVSATASLTPGFIRGTPNSLQQPGFSPKQIFNRLNM
ncbi:hypothetical protein [Sunxiuqinia indica]|uniref:hypothetical protein n=1 Tax=Sunxiuqinia indica TaxID=2692584 RepID=UPI00135A561E|nr:hypothetical protein [Sunxiuqinia indica]